MAGESEPAKLLLPYLQRADELQKHEPLVAYYCRLYAMEKGLKIPQSERTKTTNSLLVSLMNQLEKDKKSLKLGPEDSLHIEGFALNVFGKADKQDRAGRADLNTAKTFYAASIFFEILSQFGPLQPDLEQKQKYAVWKAADIRKALKEGRKPNPGPPADDDDLLVPSSTPRGGYDLGASDIAATIPRSESNLSPQFHEHINDLHATSIPPSPQFQEGINYQHSAHVLPQTQFDDSANYPHSARMPPQTQFDDSANYPHSARMPQQTQFDDSANYLHSARMSPQTQFDDSANSQHSLNNMPSPPSFPAAGYPSHDFHPPPPASGSDNSTYIPQYHHQIYPQDPQQQSPHSYPSQETSPYSYPNFQSYPSFSDSSLPSVPSHYPSYYQGSDSSYIPQSAAPTANYPSTVQRTSSGRNGAISDTLTTSSQTYQYDSSYQPPPEKIAEAHKAARFAVGALAFDDVSVAVDYLKKSLEMLTRPSAGQ